MSWPFAILAAFTLLSAIGAVTFRNPVHCALSLTVTFAALAGLYLHLNAQFVGLVQILVYIGAVAVLIVFAIMLTEGSEEFAGRSVFSPSAWAGIITAAGLFAVLATTIISTSGMRRTAEAPSEVKVRDIGEIMLSDYVMPLEVIGLLLTVALIGAVLIAVEERPDTPPEPGGQREITS